MSDSELNEDKPDPRTPCKYGSNCYQKNKAHHEKFKHPPKEISEQEEKVADKESSSSTLSPLETSSTNSDIKNKKNEKPKPNRTFLTNWLQKPANKKIKLENDESNNKTKYQISPNKTKMSPKLKQPNDSLKNDTEKFKEEEKKFVKNKNHEHKDVNLDNTDENIKDVSAINVNSNISILPLQMDVKTKIKKFFLVDMPEDFYQFWSFCESIGSLSLSKGDPLDAFKSVGLKLVGPFDVLANKFNDKIVYDSAALLRHYRYFYDPPEFQTVIKGDDKTGYHMGYFRDDPKENPVFVASNCASTNGIIKSIAENIFGAVNAYLEDYKKKADPFAKTKIVKLQSSLTSWATKENITLSTSTVAMKKREARVNTRTFHKAGLVVPYNKKTQIGYRELAETDATIKGILSNIVNSGSEEERKAHFSKLQPIITYANIANDESDFGASLELGLDLFTYGSPLFHETIKRLLTTSYSLLNRDEFATIIEAHLQDRKKGSDPGIIKKY